jgi:hypothetical protein
MKKAILEDISSAYTETIMKDLQFLHSVLESFNHNIKNVFEIEVRLNGIRIEIKSYFDDISYLFGKIT